MGYVPVILADIPARTMFIYRQSPVKSPDIKLFTANKAENDKPDVR